MFFLWPGELRRTKLHGPERGRNKGKRMRKTIPCALHKKQFWNLGDCALHKVTLRGPLFIWFEQEVCVNAITNCTQESPWSFLQRGLEFIKPFGGRREKKSPGAWSLHRRTQAALLLGMEANTCADWIFGMKCYCSSGKQNCFIAIFRGNWVSFYISVCTDPVIS